MALILNIDTSNSFCSVCVANNGEIITGFESSLKMDHSSSLAVFVDKCCEELKNKGLKLEAVSVSNGPGSYTGLRIGLSLAKGMAFGSDIPLITLSSLEILAVRAMFTYAEIDGKEIIIPMIDARRMEVYTCGYNSALEYVLEPQAMILDNDSFSQFYKEPKVVFIGDGTDKFRNIYQGSNAIWIDKGMPHARFMAPLSEKYFKENKFADVAYAVPFYLKEYQTTQAKSRL